MDQRIIYYNNFASHLLNAYNPNMYFPGLPYQWSDSDWFALLEMLAAFGFNTFEYWLEPRFFCEEGLRSEAGTEFTRQLNRVIDRAKMCGLATEMIVALATTGADWRTLCPSEPEEWAMVKRLWDEWTRRFPGLEIVGIFPGDPGACSRNGCTAETFIEKSIEIAWIIKKNLPGSHVEVHTWGPPFFGWGTIEMPAGSRGEFIPADQGSAWRFSKERSDRSMEHLVHRLPDFPPGTAVGINLGFNPDGNPVGEEDARAWAREIARTNPILTWDFSLTEGENAVTPHYRFERLYKRRQEEREAAPYSGGICFTMTPLLNQLSLYQSARSYRDPFADHREVTAEFFNRVFGIPAADLADYYPLFEVIKDWGCYSAINMPRRLYHRLMSELSDILRGLGPVSCQIPFHPDAETYRQELVFFAELFAELSGDSPDYDTLAARYWNRVYGIYDFLPAHVDPRPRGATNRLINHFKKWR